MGDGAELDLDGLKAWVGRRVSVEDTAALPPVAALSATLDRAVIISYTFVVGMPSLLAIRRAFASE